MPRPPTSDPTELFLRHLFQRATRTALVGAAVLQAGGCVQPSSHHIPPGGSDLDGGEAGTGGSGQANTNTGGGGNSGTTGGTATGGTNGPGTNGGGSDDGGTTGGSDGGSEDGGTPALSSACDDYASPLSAAGLTPSEDVDYVAVRRRSGPFGGDPDAGTEWAETQFNVVDEQGNPCATASSDACEKQVALHPVAFTPTHCLQICSELSVVTTAGDQVDHYAGAERLKALFGDVDTLSEAKLMAQTEGYQVCGGRKGTAGELLVYATRITSDCAPIITTTYELQVEQDGAVSVLRSAETNVDENACIGRKPAALHSHSRRAGRSRLGDYLAHCAHLEAASVWAFEQLAEDLERLGAPQPLVQRARAAADDERRHASQVGALARARGGKLAAVQVGSLSTRSLEEVATENAVEGCVRETFGVVVGAHQALRAGDAELADAMVGIVRDETRHAALSWDVHAWALQALDTSARARVLSAQRGAVDQLREELAQPIDARLTRDAGMPDAVAGSRMFRDLEYTLWSPACAA